MRGFSLFKYKIAVSSIALLIFVSYISYTLYLLPRQQVLSAFLNAFSSHLPIVG